MSSNTNSFSVVSALFESGAFKVAPAESPFFYTSGLIGPYFINTHYLCGGQTASERVLTRIDEFLTRGPSSVTELLPSEILEVYHSSELYKGTVGELISILKASGLPAKEMVVSGGERRDWFFSVPLAHELQLPHAYLFKAGDIIVKNPSFENDSISKYSRAVHVADLLTVGSSYESMWCPMLAKHHVAIALSINVVDRDQGGVQNLQNAGVGSVVNAVKVDDAFVSEAAERGFISDTQRSQLERFRRDSHSTMKDFLLENASFLIKALRSQGKEKDRAVKLLDVNPYQLDADYIADVRAASGL